MSTKERIEKVKGFLVDEYDLPTRYQRGPFKVTYTSDLHSTRTATLLGIALGVAFGVCFLTGVLSHAYQAGLDLPSRPVDLYRITQGLHVTTGILSVPLLIAKLWTVYPRLWQWPPAPSALGMLEKGSIFVLVGGAIFQLSTGVLNIAGWYAFGFFFTPVHYWVGWVTIGALGVHIMAKVPLIRQGLKRTPGDSLSEYTQRRRDQADT